MKSILSQERVFITGGGGFIGSHIAKKLYSLGYEVHLLWRNKTSFSRLEDKDQFIFHNIDIFDLKKLTSELKKINPQYIIHLATHSNYRGQEEVDEIVKTTVNGTLNLLISTRQIPYKIFVNTGSSSEYGFNNSPMKESDNPNPESFYAVAKLSSTLICKLYSKTYNKPIVTVRPFSVYGPGEDKSRFIPTIITSLINNNPIVLTSGDQRRDFIYIDDIVNAYVAILLSKKNLKGEIFNFGTGVEFTNDEVVRELFRVAKKKTAIKKGHYPKRLWDSNHWVADVAHSKKKLNWNTKNDLIQGLTKTFNWYTTNLYEQK